MHFLCMPGSDLDPFLRNISKIHFSDTSTRAQITRALPPLSCCTVHLLEEKEALPFSWLNTRTHYLRLVTCTNLADFKEIHQEGSKTTAKIRVFFTSTAAVKLFSPPLKSQKKKLKSRKWKGVTMVEDTLLTNLLILNTWFTFSFSSSICFLGFPP